MAPRSTENGRLAIVLSGALALALTACGGGGGGGDAGPPGPPGLPGPIVVGPDDPLPGVVAVITGLAGATGPDGTFQPGDAIAVTYTVRTDAGEALNVSAMASGAIYVSGPSFNYQRVIASQSDLRARSVYLGDGTWTYAFLVPLPAAYLPPLNDSPSFGPQDGELAGQPLLDGTYTVGMTLRQDYEIEAETFRDAGAAVRDFLVGSGAFLEHREVVTNGNCNVCHTDLRAHGNNRTDVRLCVLCHTAGAEDRNSPGVPADDPGTPGVSIDFRVMVHKLHAGKRLPSVLGVGTSPDGSRDYAKPPRPYRLVGFGDAISDFSEVGFPVFPSVAIGMPRDLGYSTLPAASRAKEDSLLLGPVACAKCHGDPDGAGALPPPAQGGLSEVQPSRKACGSCHDDVDWTRPYAANNATMPADVQESQCVLCHTVTGSALAVRTAHVHPLLNPAQNPGVRFLVSALAEAGANDGDGTVDPGEKVAVTFTIEDDGGAPVAPSSLASITAIVSGPTRNYNLLLNAAVPSALLAGSPPYTVNLPEQVVLEWVGDAGPGADVFFTSRSPHLDVAGARTVVFERTATAGGASSTTAVSVLSQNFVDVASTASFARNDLVVVGDGTPAEEYAQVVFVDGARLWLGTPLRFAHGAGTPVLEVALTQRTAGTHYALTAATGQVSEGPTPFGTGNAVVVTYGTDFVLPARYPPPLNDSPDLGEEWGEWTGKSLVAGTYTLDLYGSVNRFVNYDGTSLPSTAGFPDATTYRGTSAGGSVDFLVGTASVLEPYAVISEAANCYACHDDLWFHGGGRRSFVTCIVCHGSAGGEDRARYTAANAPATTGVRISFREMLHKIHKGAELTHADTYTVVGFGGSPYPNNFTAHTYGEVVFPAMPGGVRQCVRCHGNDAWKEPEPRDHPTEQVVGARVWGLVCGSCHDSDPAHAHIDVNTAVDGTESCSICHGPGEDLAVERVHRAR